jgi:hypothetical protein
MHRLLRGGVEMTINWPEAVARLAGERTRAEVLAGLLKKHGNAAQRDHGALLYAEAKTEVDAVIDGLLVVLAQRDAPTTLPDLEARLTRMVQRGAELRDYVRPLLPDATGQKAGIGDILAKTVEALLNPLIEAVGAIWNARREDDALTRATIRTQLGGTRWLAFAAIAPAE